MSHVPAAVCALAASLMFGLCAMQLFVQALCAGVVFGVYALIVARVKGVGALRAVGALTLAVLAAVLALAYDWTPG